MLWASTDATTSVPPIRNNFKFCAGFATVISDHVSKRYYSSGWQGIYSCSNMIKQDRQVRFKLSFAATNLTATADTYQLLSCFADLEPKLHFQGFANEATAIAFLLRPLPNSAGRPASPGWVEAPGRHGGCRALYDKLRDGYQLCNCCEKNAKLHQARRRAIREWRANPRTTTTIRDVREVTWSRSRVKNMWEVLQQKSYDVVRLLAPLFSWCKNHPDMLSREWTTCGARRSDAQRQRQSGGSISTSSHHLELTSHHK